MKKIRYDVPRLKEGAPTIMDFSCPLEDDYIFELSNFAFL
jgi:hypothetical protein